YPHEIEIATAGPQQSGDRLATGKLHAYIGGPPAFAGSMPKDVVSAPSLGSFVVVRVNPGSALAKDENLACAVTGAGVRALTAVGGDARAHPYPVTPLHGDYLQHADLADAAKARFASSGALVPAAPAPTPKVRAEGALAEALVPPDWRADGAG